jgi:hypothetical protein
MAKQSNRMLMPDDDDLEPIEIDQEEKKRWIRGLDKIPAMPVELPTAPPPAPEPVITKEKILLTIDSDMLELCTRAAKKRRKTRTAWIIEACLEKLERENIQ